MRKLNAEAIADIRQYRADGHSYRQIAEVFGIATTTVRYYLHPNTVKATHKKYRDNLRTTRMESQRSR